MNTEGGLDRTTEVQAKILGGRKTMGQLGCVVETGQLGFAKCMTCLVRMFRPWAMDQLTQSCTRGLSLLMLSRSSRLLMPLFGLTPSGPSSAGKPCLKGLLRSMRRRRRRRLHRSMRRRRRRGLLRSMRRFRQKRLLRTTRCRRRKERFNSMRCRLREWTRTGQRREWIRTRLHHRR